MDLTAAEKAALGEAEDRLSLFASAHPLRKGVFDKVWSALGMLYFGPTHACVADAIDPGAPSGCQSEANTMYKLIISEL